MQNGVSLFLLLCYRRCCKQKDHCRYEGMVHERIGYATNEQK